MADTERAAIVAWLRLYADDPLEPHTGTARKALKIAADAVERGLGIIQKAEAYHWLGADAE